MKTTFGQAVDAAVNAHLVRYPESFVYAARASLTTTHPDCIKVEVDAAHLSCTLTYWVKVDGGTAYPDAF